MLKIFENFSLKKLNTFGIDIKTKYFVQITTVNELLELFANKKFINERKEILGFGSNILFTKDFDGLIIQPKILFKKIIKNTKDFVVVKVGAGEIWDDFVKYCVTNNFYGAENLSKIPGTVGACPIQNIGAYGVEAKDIIQEVEFFRIAQKKLDIYNNKVCNFGYRKSIFKTDLKSKIIITSVTFRLSKHINFNIEYKGIREELNKYEIIDIQNVRNAIINIRQNKLPDTEKLGNAGSFFKNPIISKEQFEALNNKFQNIPYYSIPNNLYKIPAAYLIDKSGFKGYKSKNAGVCKTQPLVLVNFGNSTGLEILELATIIENGVFQKFGIKLEKEVNIISKLTIK